MLPLLKQNKEPYAYLLDMILKSSVADPDPKPDQDPPDPRVLAFGPPGSRSGSISQRYGSGSGSFYHLISTVLWLLFDFLSLKNDVKVPSERNMKKTFFVKLVFCWHLESQ